MAYDIEDTALMAKILAGGNPVELDPIANAGHRCVPCSLVGSVVGATYRTAYADGNWPVKVCGKCAETHKAEGAAVWAWMPES